MSELPTGVVTLLFTDVEGSTRLWERDPDVMRAALVRHDAIVAEHVRQHGGIVVKSRGEGDSFFAIFGRAANAVAAALSIQQALYKQVWRTDAPLRVRMAIHTGKVELRESDYYGPTVNRCARLRALAHGGQVLLSGVTAQLVASSLPVGASLHDLGTHRLKDLSAPERVCEVVHADLPSEFPPIRSVDVVNLDGHLAPAQPQAEPAGAVRPAAPPTHRRYKLVDEHNHSPDGRDWAEGLTHQASGRGSLDGDGWILCYHSPKVAALLNQVYENVARPRLWEVAVRGEVEPESAQIPCTEATALRAVGMPRLTAEDRARFAVLATRSAYRNGLFVEDFSQWSRKWLAGQDRAADAARQIQTLAENDAYRGSQLANLGALAASKAAEAAVHAARGAWLRGRAADEEAAIVVQAAAEALRVAMRVSRLDVVELANQAVAADLDESPLTSPSRPGAWRVA